MGFSETEFLYSKFFFLNSLVFYFNFFLVKNVCYEKLISNMFRDKINNYFNNTNKYFNAIDVILFRKIPNVII